MRRAALLGSFLVAWGCGPVLLAQPPVRPVDGATRVAPLYRLQIIQAAPGRLVELIDAAKKRAALAVTAGDEAPVIVRHSQGDHWDLVVLWPMGDWSAFYEPARVARREGILKDAGLTPRGLERQFLTLVAWHEDLYARGPAVEALRAHVKDASLLHFEMMQSLPGKRDALVEERRMENAFNRNRGPRRNADLRPRRRRRLGRRHARRLPQLASLCRKRVDLSRGRTTPPRRRPASRAPTASGPT